METTKDFSLLRPFDPEAAKRKEAVCWHTDGMEYDEVLFLKKGTLVAVPKDEPVGGEFSHSEATKYLRMAPLCWVEGKPVYKGDRLWLKKAGSEIVADGIAKNSGQQDCIISDFQDPHDEMWWPTEHLTWTKLTVKREGFVAVKTNDYPRNYAAWCSHVCTTKKQAEEHYGPNQPVYIVHIEWEEPA